MLIHFYTSIASHSAIRSVHRNIVKFNWTADNIASKDFRLALMKVNLISHDLGYLQEKFGFSDEDMQSVPQAPFKYSRETFKDKAFSASQYKMLHKLSLCDLAQV